MSVAGAVIIIATEPVSECTAQPLMALSCNSKSNLIDCSKDSLKIYLMNRVLPDNGGRRLGIDRRQFSYTAHIPERRSGKERRSGFDRRLEPKLSR